MTDHDPTTPPGPDAIEVDAVAVLNRVASSGPIGEALVRAAIAEERLARALAAEDT